MTSFKSETFTPDNLTAGNESLLFSRKVNIAAGEVLPRGALLGKVSASGEYRLSLAAETDGSETPDAILVDDVDASAGATEAMIYLRGDFHAPALTLGTGHTLDSVFEGLRGKGIFVK